MEENANLNSDDVDCMLINESCVLSSMSEEQISQHLSLCLKLDAENKINAKNAFSLHLVQILYQKVRIGVTDLHFASLALQASSKIYAGRIEALYKETICFNNYLQTVISNKRVTEKQPPHDNANNEDNTVCIETERLTDRWSTTETSITKKSETNHIAIFPHANFITIESAFTDSLIVPSLLESLILENDCFKYAVILSALCFNPRKHASICEFLFPHKRIGLIKKVQSLEIIYHEHISIASSNVFYADSINLPVGLELELNDSLYIGNEHIEKEKDNNVEGIAEILSFLHITPNLFANDLSLAIVNGDTLDRTLLPPNSTLKRILDNAEKKKALKTQKIKGHKEKPPQKPFFNRQSVFDESLICRGRRTKFVAFSKWKPEDTTDLLASSHDKFSKVLADCDKEESTTHHTEVRKILDKLMQENKPQYSFNNYFLKSKQPWNLFARKASTCSSHPSSHGVCLNNENEFSNPTNILETNSNCILQSFQNLSIQNSLVESDDDSLPHSLFPEEPIGALVETASFFEDDLKSILVTPPELAKTIIMKYQIEPINLNTEKIKKAMWNIIEKTEETYLSIVYEKLKIVFENKKLPLQYVFTILLLLANEKCLFIENISSSDLKITKDVCEIEDSDNNSNEQL